MRKQFLLSQALYECFHPVKAYIEFVDQRIQLTVYLPSIHQTVRFCKQGETEVKQKFGGEAVLDESVLPMHNIEIRQAMSISAVKQSASITAASNKNTADSEAIQQQQPMDTSAT